MYYSKVSKNIYLIRLKKAEKVCSSIKIFCQKMGIKNGYLSAIGSIEDPNLAHYRVDTKKYTEKRLKGVFEVAPLTGNIGLHQGQPLIHNHILISDQSMRSFGGHLVEAKVSATLEVILIKFDSQLTKSHDAEIGLKLYDLDKELRGK